MLLQLVAAGSALRSGSRLHSPTFAPSFIGSMDRKPQLQEQAAQKSDQSICAYDEHKEFLRNKRFDGKDKLIKDPSSMQLSGIKKPICPAFKPSDILCLLTCDRYLHTPNSDDLQGEPTNVQFNLDPLPFFYKDNSKSKVSF